MTATRLDGIFDVHHAFLGNADHAAGDLDTGEYVLDHGAALVQHECGLDLVLLKVIDNMHSTLAIDLLAARECEIYVAFGSEALRDQGVCRKQNAVKGHLGVKRTASPHASVLQECLECGHVPCILVDGNDVVVRHQHCGIAVGLAFPMKEQTAIGHALHGAGGKNTRVQRGKGVDQLFKFRVVLKRGIAVRDCLAAYQRAKRFRSAFLVKCHGCLIYGGLCFRLECQRTNENDRKHNGCK